MWLNHFQKGEIPSQNSNATSPQRSYSPLPRRSTQTAPQLRPSLGGRSASQASLVSNDSTSSIPKSSGRPANGSSLKNQVNNVPPSNVEDPLLVLGHIIGANAKQDANGEVANGEGQETVEKPSVLAEDIDFDGLSLQEFVDREALRLKSTSNIASFSEQSVEEYEKDRDKFEELHKSINACDEVLQSVEKYLSSFQTDLGNVSTEIESLQSRSMNLNGRLENRRRVEKLLGPTVDRIGLPSNVVKKISEGAIDDSWVRALFELQERSKMLEAEDITNVYALNDVKPLVDDLAKKAVQQIKDYFAAQIRSLRSPNVNAQLIQQQGFLRFKSLYAFLAAREPQLGEEIMQAYANTMRWYYYMHFTRYHNSLLRLKLYTADRHDGIGEDPASAARSRASSNNTPSQDIFSLGRRIDVIRNHASTAIPSHAAEEAKQAQYLEIPFQAYNLALIDNASFEYTFLTAFFSSDEPASTPTTKQPTPAASNLSALHRHFQTMFSPVLNLGTTLTKSLISETFDALGILLLVRLTQQFAFTTQRRKIPALEPYLNGTNMLLWPRFQVVIDANCNSLKQLTSSLPSRSGAASSASASFSLAGSGGSGANTAPHPVTQRFANFARSIISLSSEAGEDEPVSNSLGRLRGEYEAFLAKAAASLGSGEKARKEKKKFLGNNYSLVLTIIADARGRLAGETRSHFEELKQGVV